MTQFVLCSGLLKGVGETEAARYTTQGCDAQDHLPAALVPSSSAEKRISGHEAGSHFNTGKPTADMIYYLL